MAELLELHALDDLAVTDVHAGDDALGQHQAHTVEEVAQDLPALRRLISPGGTERRRCCPARPPTRTCSRASSTATHSGVTGAAKECVKYTCAPEVSPVRSRAEPRKSREFQPTCGTFSR